MSKNVFKINFKVNEKVDAALKYVKYLVLLLLIVVVWTMGLPLYKVESVCGGDCINCLKCIETCPRSNTKVNVLGENITPELASSVAIAAMVGLYAINNVGGICIS
ncbi:hypothetical protein K9O30_07850 [Clostridium bowmanii]|uniref:hypothetical protein n=1 Tax=Clostridium bowmanii TaxID=132925 RepID=UPI001CD3DE6F|nr:hypothetical protein [Clostridium bowmanii]MCA1073641.1 hypothetical protein [Clostridium bowmanii]